MAKYTYRCPWCGCFVKPPSEKYITVRTCPNCHHNYSYYWSKKLIVWEIVWTLCLIVSVNALLKLLIGEITIIQLIIYLSITTALTPQLYIEKVLKRQFQTNDVSAKNSYTATLHTSSPLKYNLTENAVITISYEGKSDYPSKDQVCVSISNIKRTKYGIICNLSSLPYGIKIDLDVDDKFYVICSSDTEFISGIILKKNTSNNSIE